MASKSSVVFFASLAVLLCFCIATCICLWNLPDMGRMIPSLDPLLCCYVPLFISGILIPEPSLDRRWPSVVFWGSFAMFILAILNPTAVNSVRNFQYRFLPPGPSIALQETLLFVAAPIFHLIMLAVGTIIPKSRHLYSSPLFIAGGVLACSPIWAIPIVSTGSWLQGESALAVLIYPIIYTPLGIYMLLFGVFRRRQKSRHHS